MGRRRIQIWLVLAAVLCGALCGSGVVGSAPAIAATSGPDLVANVSGGAPAVSGATAPFVVAVSNVGGVGSSGAISVQLSMTGDSGVALSATGSGWDCSGTAQECTTETAATPGGQLPDITVNVPVGELLGNGGTVGLKAVVSNSSDTTTADDSASAEEPVVASDGVDLVPVIAPSPPVAAGADATFELGVENVGELASNGNVEVIIAPEGDVGGEWSASGSGWSCPHGSDRCTTTTSVSAGATLAELTVHVPTEVSFPDSHWVGLGVQISNSSDAVALNDSASAQVPLGPPSGVDLEVGAHGDGPVAAGQDASFSRRCAMLVTRLPLVRWSFD